MKRVLLPLLALLPGAGLLAQDKLGTYELAHFQQAFDVSATKRGAFSIDCPAVGSPDTRGGITVDGEDIEAFRAVLAKARDRFAEALAAPATAGTLRLEAVSPKIDCYFFHEGGRFDSFSKRMAFRLKVEEGKPLLVGTTGPVNSPDAPAVKLSGMTIVFTTVEEVDALLALADPKKAEAHFGGK